MHDAWLQDDADAMLRDSVARFVEHEYGFAQRRQRLAAPPSARGCWGQMAELGWLGLPFAETLGGLGGNWQQVALLLREFGRGLVLEPYLPNVVLAGELLARLGTAEQQARYLGALIEGRGQIALANAEPGARHRLDDCATQAEATAHGHRLQGHKTVVLGGASADAFIVLARSSGPRCGSAGLSFFIVEANAPGLLVQRYRLHDGQHAAELRLDGVLLPPEALLGQAGAAHAELERAIDHAAALACAEACGVLQLLFDDTLAYLKQRQQFGRPLANNQALQHRLVDMHIQWREAEAMTLAAVQALQADAGTRARTVSATKLHVGQALRLLGQEAVQLHGAIGTTDDCRVSHGFKRATLLGLQFGDADHHRRRFAGLMAEAFSADAGHSAGTASTAQVTTEGTTGTTA